MASSHVSWKCFIGWCPWSRAVYDKMTSNATYNSNMYRLADDFVAWCSVQLLQCRPLLLLSEYSTCECPCLTDTRVSGRKGCGSCNRYGNHLWDYHRRQGCGTPPLLQEVFKGAILKMVSVNYRPGIKCRLRVKTDWEPGEMQTAGCMQTFSVYRYISIIECWPKARIFKHIIVKVCTLVSLKIT